MISVRMQNSEPRSAPDSFELKLCQACAPEVYQQRLELIPYFEKLEAIFSGLKGTDRHLPYRMIKKLTRREHWNFDEFWMIPGWWRYRKHIRQTRGLFRDLPENERYAISVLYGIFKNIEVVSIILRFIDPDNYGIISPPVRCALGMKARDNYVDEHLDYLSALRMYALEYGFERAADADVALWALVEKCLRAKDAQCPNFKKYQEKLIKIEEEYIRKSQLFKKMEEEILEVMGEEETRKQAELERMRKELRDLMRERESFPVNLIKLEKSPHNPEEKIIHDRREPDVDGGQKHFMKKLSEDPYVNKIIWSENVRAKHPTRIAEIKDDGELTLLYVNKDNYAAKIKVWPLRCADRTHARFFAGLVRKAMGIPMGEG
jgi:hypothetical protein